LHFWQAGPLTFDFEIVWPTACLELFRELNKLDFNFCGDYDNCSQSYSQ